MRWLIWRRAIDTIAWKRKPNKIRTHKRETISVIQSIPNTNQIERFVDRIRPLQICPRILKIVLLATLDWNVKCLSEKGVFSVFVDFHFRKSYWNMKYILRQISRHPNWIQRIDFKRKHLEMHNNASAYD